MSEAELALRIQFLEKSRDEELAARKYTHIMIENLHPRLANLEQMAVRFEENLRSGTSTGDRRAETLANIDKRLIAVERLVWVAVGATGIIGAIVAIIGGNILRLLSH